MSENIVEIKVYSYEEWHKAELMVVTELASRFPQSTLRVSPWYIAGLVVADIAGVHYEFNMSDLTQGLVLI